MKHTSRYFPYILMGYHLLFSVIGWKYIMLNNGDAVRYWFVGQDLSGVSWSSFFQPGTDIIKIFTFPLVKYFHLPFYIGFLIFSAISAIGFYRLWKLLMKISGISMPAQMFSFVLLLFPDVHFWTSLIGKESPLFVAIVIAVAELYQKKILSRRLWLSILFVALVRPHVAAVIIFSFGIAVLLDKKIILKIKGIVLFLSIIGGYLLYQLLFIVTKTKVSLTERIQFLYHLHITKLREKEAHVPLDEYSLPYKLFTFYFRPLPLEKEGWFYGIWSIENAIQLFIFCVLIYVTVRNFQKIRCTFVMVFSIVFIFAFALMYVYAYANWGLISRTKILALPMLAVFMVEILKTVTIKTKT